MFKAATLARACRAGLAGFVLVTLSVSFAQAEYGPRTTIGNNYQQTSDTVSENGVNQSTHCTNTQFCFVLFQTAPQQKPLIVQHVSCHLSVSPGVVRTARLVTRSGQDFVGRLSYLVPVHTEGAFWVINNPVMHLLKSGERAVIRLSSSVATDWGANDCNISGKLQQP